MDTKVSVGSHSKSRKFRVLGRQQFLQTVSLIPRPHSPLSYCQFGQLVSVLPTRRLASGPPLGPTFDSQQQGEQDSTPSSGRDYCFVSHDSVVNRERQATQVTKDVPGVRSTD